MGGPFEVSNRVVIRADARGASAPTDRPTPLNSYERRALLAGHVLGIAIAAAILADLLG